MVKSDPQEYQFSADEPHKDEDILRQLYHGEELTLREMAPILGVSDATVYRWMDRLGVELRTKSEARGGGVSYHTSKRGYPIIGVSEGTYSVPVRVHALVAIAAGASPRKVFSDGEYHVHHKNGIPWDNRPENLAVIRAGEHITEHGLPEQFHGPYNREDGRWAPED